ncbi:MAG: AtpZ/AtpI family protein [Actinomycetota bacterium]
MKLLSRISSPLRRTVRADLRVDASAGPGHGLDAVATLVVFLGIGFGIDRLAGTMPVFMIVFTLLAGVGLFAKFKYRYDESMDRLEAERLAKLAGPAVRHDAETEAA